MPRNEFCIKLVLQFRFSKKIQYLRLLKDSSINKLQKIDFT